VAGLQGEVASEALALGTFDATANFQFDRCTFKAITDHSDNGPLARFPITASGTAKVAINSVGKRDVLTALSRNIQPGRHPNNNLFAAHRAQPQDRAGLRLAPFPERIEEKLIPLPNGFMGRGGIDVRRALPAPPRNVDGRQRQDISAWHVRRTALSA
jgi:hypothetical protein